jgi:GH24 family phage-related lysozyme (muramidase)
MSTSPGDGDDVISTVRLKLLDPLGRAIHGLKYEIRQGAKVVARGMTDIEGRLEQISSEIGKPLSVLVERFVADGMKEVRQLTPWNDRFSVKLVSGKVKEAATIAKDRGDPGTYRRKTHAIETGDTLSGIAKTHGTTAQEIAALNGISVKSILHVGQVLKLPLPSTTSAAPSQGPAPGPVSAPTASRVPTPAPRPVEPSATNGPAPSPATTNPPVPTPVPQTDPPPISVAEARGENGTPKTTVTLKCEAACVKLGDKGPFVEELNIRLTGFGGTVSSPNSLNEFTDKTERAVRQFQRDYMGVAENGNVCAPLLKALDEFRAQYPISLASMRCPCGKCEGFGNNYTDSTKVEMFSDAKSKKAYKGTEYPGMHRAVLWAMRAALFYIDVKDKHLTYRFKRVSSGYRCWHDNKAHKRTSTNHMGNALDLQFTKGNSTTRCQGTDIEDLRSDIFVKRLGAQLSWPDDNRLSLETAAQGATSWVHVDVREYEAQYKDTRFYAVTQAAADGDPMIEIAKREGRLPLLACGGLSAVTMSPVASDRGMPPAPTYIGGTTPIDAAPASSSSAALSVTTTTERTAILSLSISQKGVDFIKGWEKCGLQPYDDSEGFCTIGWGHLIERASCKAIKDEPGYNSYKNGIDQATADKLLINDIRKIEGIVRERVQVPMFQHEYDALVSLIFNMGSFKKCPKLLSKLNTKDYKGCCDEFADITNRGTEGLVKRRKAEMNIFNNKVYDASH